ncbi:ras gtpase-activating protein [Anaeramoeba flamelloides]|uniref:Ras gtpase-activating protein n=1 Tax=Anaeramoeba flamelloides TaxID=1746091 RepID=A0ABQ8X5L0_9EUKA|nr:ras gtpase-activating protein [Anaeramoeba flamelloides]
MSEIQDLLKKVSNSEENYLTEGKSILRKWINSKLTLIDISKQISNFEKDLTDCFVVSLLYHYFYPNLGFEKVNSLKDTKERFTLLCKLLKSTDLNYLFPSTEEIQKEKGKFFLYILLKLYLQKEQKLEEKNKIEIEKEKEKEHHNKENKTTPNGNENDLDQEITITKEEEKTNFQPKQNQFQPLDKKNEEFQLLQQWSSLGSEMMESFGKQNQEIVQFYKEMGEILPEYLPTFTDLKQQLKIICEPNLKKQTKYSPPNILVEKTFFKILKSYNFNELELDIKTKLKDKFRNIETYEEQNMQQFIQDILQICKESEIITDEKSDLSRSIIALIDQFFYSTVFIMELTDEILTKLIRYKVYQISTRDKEYDELRNTIFLILNHFMPGNSDFYLAQKIVTNLFEQLGFQEEIKDQKLYELITNCRRAAFGRTMYLLIHRYLGSSFYDQVIQFFEKSKKGKDFQELWNTQILPQCRSALENYLIREDAENLIFSVESSICRERADAYSAQLLVLLDSLGVILPFVKVGIIQEVLKNPSPGSLFRSNDVISKILKLYMKMIGPEYLKKTLSGPLQEIISNDLDFEIDKYLVPEEEKYNQNLKNLKFYLAKILESIFNSIEWMPMEIKVICSYYSEVTKAKYPKKVSITVGGFLFLRFICPTIVAPVKLGLVKGVVDSQTRRGLMLISSIIQSMSNELFFKETREYMMPMNEDIKKYLPQCREFLSKAANPKNVEMKPILKPFSTNWKSYTRGPIQDIYVHEFFRPTEMESINPELFGANLLLDTKKWIPMDLSTIGISYFNCIYNRLDQFVDVVSNLTKTVNQVEVLTQTINQSNGWLGNQKKKSSKKSNKKKQEKDIKKNEIEIDNMKKNEKGDNNENVNNNNKGKSPKSPKNPKSPKSPKSPKIAISAKKSNKKKKKKSKSKKKKK